MAISRQHRLLLAAVIAALLLAAVASVIGTEDFFAFLDANRTPSEFQSD